MLRLATAALAALLAFQDVREKRDLAYFEGEGADPKKHRLDLHLPPAGDKPFPVVMWIHGGGWRNGDRSMYAALGRRFAERGIGLAAIGYRLSPGVKHPDHVKDCARAFAWLRENAAKHGGDPERLFVCGQSAGGHLTALLALDRKHLDALKVPADAIKGAIPMSGVYEIPALSEETRGPLAIFPAAFGSDPEVCRDASPVTHARHARAPMLVLTEVDDNFRVRPSMKAFQAALEMEGISNARFVDAKGRDHISIVTRMMRPGEDEVRDAIVEFVEKRCAELDGKR
jgi:acetyl esterase/lipase